VLTDVPEFFPTSTFLWAAATVLSRRSNLNRYTSRLGLTPTRGERPGRRLRARFADATRSISIHTHSQASRSYQKFLRYLRNRSRPRNWRPSPNECDTDSSTRSSGGESSPPRTPPTGSPERTVGFCKHGRPNHTHRSCCADRRGFSDSREKAARVLKPMPLFPAPASVTPPTPDTLPDSHSQST
jgi:hypothetical protein